MKGRVALLLALVAALAASCVPTVIEGSGDLVTETREVAGVSSVALSGMGDLTIRQTGVEALRVTVDGNLMENLRTEVRNGKLVIDLGSRTPGVVLRPSETPLYELDVIDIGAIAVSGSGSVAADSLRTSQMAMAVSGSGDIRIGSLDVEKVEAAISGSGDIVLAGRADVQSVAVSGSGTYSAQQFESSKAAAAIAGSGDVTIWTTDSLDVSITGSGSVSYYGGPEVTTRIAGSGSVRALGPKKMTL